MADDNTISSNRLVPDKMKSIRRTNNGRFRNRNKMGSGAEEEGGDIFFPTEIFIVRITRDSERNER